MTSGPGGPSAPQKPPPTIANEQEDSMSNHQKRSFRDAVRNRSSNIQRSGGAKQSHKRIRRPVQDPNKTENGCLKATEEMPQVEIRSTRVSSGIKLLTNQGLICRFLGYRIQPSAIEAWVHRTWEIKGDLIVSHYSNGYFLVTFATEDDRDAIFQGGPWFYGRAGLFMKPWHPGFKPCEEVPTVAPVWVRLPDFPPEYWYEEVFEQIGDSIGEFLFASDRTLEKKSTSYARICVQLDLQAPLPATVCLHFPDDDLVWEQVVDYENIPFRCRVCAEYGHLARCCPLAVVNTNQVEAPTEGFKQPKGRNNSGKSPAPTSTSSPSLPKTKDTQETLQDPNPFNVLQTDEAQEDSPTFQHHQSPLVTTLETQNPSPFPSTINPLYSTSEQTLSTPFAMNQPIANTPLLEMDLNMVDAPPQNPPDSASQQKPPPSHHPTSYSANKTIPLKQTTNILKNPNSGIQKRKGRKTNQATLQQLAREDIEEGSQSQIDMLLEAKKLQKVSQ